MKRVRCKKSGLHHHLVLDGRQMFRRVSARAVEEAAQTASGPDHASDSESVLETERSNLTDCLGALLDVGRYFDPGADFECSGLHCVSNPCCLFLKVYQH